MNTIPLNIEKNSETNSEGHLKPLAALFVQRLEKIIKSYQLFHLLFIFFIGLEITALFLFFTLLSNSFMLALALGGLFLTIFSYFILRIYLQTKKPLHYRQCIQEYRTSCQEQMADEDGTPHYHIALAQAFSCLADELEGKEYHVYKQTSKPSLNTILAKISCWLYWKDFHLLKELLLKSSVEENIKFVKCAPTVLESHVALATSYVMLSGLYVDPRKLADEEDRWVPQEAYAETMKEKFRTTAKRAIEEFKIIKDFAPTDLWVHSQLAYSYHDLQMPEEEIAEYEILFKLNPHDRETLYKLGSLYFQQGLNAKGLQIYDALKKINPNKADQLINQYGAYAI